MSSSTTSDVQDAKKQTVPGATTKNRYGQNVTSQHTPSASLHSYRQEVPPSYMAYTGFEDNQQIHDWYTAGTSYAPSSASSDRRPLPVPPVFAFGTLPTASTNAVTQNSQGESYLNSWQAEVSRVFAAGSDKGWPPMPSTMASASPRKSVSLAPGHDPSTSTTSIYFSAGLSYTKRAFFAAVVVEEGVHGITEGDIYHTVHLQGLIDTIVQELIAALGSRITEQTNSNVERSSTAQSLTGTDEIDLHVK
jgi:hypothetical protein